MIIVIALLIIIVLALLWELRYQRRVVAWCDEREQYIGPLAAGARYAMASNIPSSSGFRAYFRNMGGTMMLSKEGVRDAPHLLVQHEALITAHKGVITEIRNAYEALSLWEQTTPVPKRWEWRSPKVKVDVKPNPHPPIEPRQPAITDGKIIDL